MKAYVINLARRGDRMARFQRWNSGKLDYERVDAIDGRQLDAQQLVPGWSRGQLGCMLSHQMIWRMIDRGADASALVIEDDAWLTPECPTWCEAIPANAELVHVGYNLDVPLDVEWMPGCAAQLVFASDAFTTQLGGFAAAGAGRYRAIVPVRRVFGTLAYWVSIAAARSLLQMTSDLAAWSEHPAVDRALNELDARGSIRRMAFWPPLAIGPNEHRDSDAGGEEILHHQAAISSSPAPAGGAAYRVETWR